LEILEVGTTSEPVHCTVCGMVVLEPQDPGTLEPWNPTPACEHVWGHRHDYGIAYLSPTARAQLAASGVLVIDDGNFGIDLELSEDSDLGDDRDQRTVLTETIPGPGAVILAVHAVLPTLTGTYVGVAEKLE